MFNSSDEMVLKSDRKILKIMHAIIYKTKEEIPIYKVYFSERNKLELTYEQIYNLLTKKELKKLNKNNELIKEFTIDHWMTPASSMPIIHRTSKTRVRVAGKERILSKFIGMSGKPNSPIINFITRATFEPNKKYKTKIQLMDLNKWRKGKYLYTMNLKEFNEILKVCEIKLLCTCPFWHWGGLKYMATQLDSAIETTDIPNPIWRMRPGYSEPSLCKHLKGVLPLIKKDLGKILRLLKDRYSTRFR